MLTPAQLRAARALLGIDQRTLAEFAGVSLPTIQRMEASGSGYVRGVVESLTKVVEALEREGIELIKENAVSTGGGRGVRMRDPTSPTLRAPPRRALDKASVA
ncbi:MAG TPA: helix-turn-helix domain-containing protein [Dongiaceae bacterium]